MFKPITIDTLGDLHHGAARLAINAEIARAVADIDDRGDDGKERKVTVELSLQKMDDALTVALIRCQAKLPPRQTAATVAKIQYKNGEAQLAFQDMAPEDPSQRTIDERLEGPNGEES